MAVSSLRSASSKQLASIIVPILIVITIIFNVLALIFGIYWSQQPFPGSLFYPRLVLTDNYDPDWQAHQQGLQAGDVLLSLDEEAISSGRHLLLLLHQKKQGDQVTLGFERAAASTNDVVETVPVTLNVFPSQDLFIFFWLPYLIGLVYLALGVIVYRLRGLERVSVVFAAFCMFVAIFAAGIFDQYGFHLLLPVWAVAFPLIAAGLVHLAFVFPVQLAYITRRPWVGFIPYGLAALLGAANLYSLYFASNPRLYVTLRLWNFGFIGLSVLLFLAILVRVRTSTISVHVRQQATILVGGSLLSFGPLVIWIFSNVLGYGWPISGPVMTLVFAPLLIFPIAVTYASLRYRLLDLDLVFSKAGVYTLLTVVVTLVYAAFVSVLGILLQDNGIFQNPIVLAVFVLTLVIFLEPVRRRFQRFIHRFFIPEPFDSRQTLQHFSRGLISTPLDTDLILKMLVKQADEALGPNPGLVFLKDPAINAFSIRHLHNRNDAQAVEVRFALDDDLAQWLIDSIDILQLNLDGTAPPGVNISREELARLRMLNINLCVPLLGSKYLLGWLALGLKNSGQPYTSSDLMFLVTLASQTSIALENAHLLEQANRRAAELEALQKISAQIQIEAEPDQLLMTVVQRATQLLNAEGGLAYLLESDEKTLKVVISHNLDQDYTGYAVDIGEGVAGRVLMSGESVVVDNFRNFSGRSRKFHDAEFGAVLGVPLRWRDKVRGVLYLVHRPGGLRFNEGDVWLMEFFATQAAIALEKSQLLQEAQHRADQLTILSEVSMAISSTLHMDTALERVMDRAVEILNAEAGSLLLMDPRGQELVFEVVLGPTGDELLGMRTPIGKGIVGTVAQTGQPLIINDVAADPRWNVAFDEATEFHTKDILCIPMIAHQQVVGVIEVINKQNGALFDEADANLLLSFGAQAAIAIENAQIFTSTDQALAGRIQELQTIQMFEQELQASSLELEKVLSLSLGRIMDSLGLSIGLMGVLKGMAEPELYLVHQRGMPMELGRYRIDPWPLSRGILGRVARTGEMAWVNDITQERDYVPKNHTTRSMLVLPILREGRVIGIIDLESTEPDYFASDDVSFVRLLVNHAAIAIENAQLFEQVKWANQAKTVFMNTASHELKIPMTSIKGYAKLLKMGAGGELSEQQQEFLTVIMNNVDRMTGLVNDLLDVSRIEAGRIRLEIQDVQMRDVIEEVIQSVHNQIESKHLDLNLAIADDLPEVRADYNRMIQIVTNLVSNAYKYTPEEGQIKVTAQPYNGTLEGIAVTVADTGFGISEEDQAKLFTTFFRSGDQNIRDEPGTGLGLVITKNMIESHGGELSFESQLGQGTAFTFTIPLVCKIPPGVEVVER